jgi:archaellum component FlaG (FlaF/FlaG flagellin family)
MSGNEDVGEGDETLKTIDIKEKGSVTIPSTSTDKTALLKGQNVTVAEFTIKPSNNNEGITLDQLVISGTINNGTTTT